MKCHLANQSFKFCIAQCSNLQEKIFRKTNVYYRKFFSLYGALHLNFRILTLNIRKTINFTNVFAPYFQCLTLNSFSGKDFDFMGKNSAAQRGSIKFTYVYLKPT